MAVIVIRSNVFSAADFYVLESPVRTEPGSVVVNRKGRQRPQVRAGNGHIVGLSTFHSPSSVDRRDDEAGVHRDLRRAPAPRQGKLKVRLRSLSKTQPPGD